MSAAFQIVLEHIGGDAHCHIFRLAFESSAERLLLPYPEVTALQFTTPTGEKLADWGTCVMAIEPLDEFVLTPGARIAFDLKAHVNMKPDVERRRWTVQLPAGRTNAHYLFEVQPDRQRYDFLAKLAKGSRFAGITKLWDGVVKSNVLEFTTT